MLQVGRFSRSILSVYGRDILSGGSGIKAPRILPLPLSACLTIPNHRLCGVMCGPYNTLHKTLQRGGCPTGSLESEPLRWYLLNRRSMER